MLNRSPARYRRYRAPTDNNTALIEPSVTQLSRESIDFGGVSLLGKSLTVLRTEAREELLAAASDYTSAYRDLPTAPNNAQESKFILTGHQAELFHPGVWFKNYMASRIVREWNGVGIHLIIDSDVSRSASLRVPTGPVDAPHVESLSYDAATSALPVEVRRVADRSLFESFAKRTELTLGSLVEDPLVGKLWPRVIGAIDRNDGNLGLALAQARHQIEEDWGASTLEIPLSRCCELPSFRWFLCSLLADAPRLRNDYNGALAAYRRAHRIRTDAQPMPDLHADEDGCETPFWVWSTKNPQRRALFIRRIADQVELADRHGWTARLDLTSDGLPETAIEQLANLSAAGVRIRTRALTTTLFARLVLSDLFLHGIGGAKYDEVTDDLSERLFGIAPPSYLTLSATLLLPIKHHRGEADYLQQVRGWFREMQYHPEKYVAADADAEVRTIVEKKQRWIATPKTPQNAAERHQAIVAANAALQPAIDGKRRRIESREKKLEQLVRAATLLDARDYSFCLFPEEDLRERMLQMVTPST